MALNMLPPELFLHLAQFLTTDSLSALIRTQKSLASLSTPCLYRDIIKSARFVKHIFEPLRLSLTRPQWLQCINQWHYQTILNYFRGIPVQLIEPRWDREDHINSLLHLAAEEGNIELVDIFVTKGLGINYHFDYCQTPLCVAVQSKQDKMALWLLEAGASVFLACKSPCAVLESAVKCSLPLLQLLLENIERYDGPCCDLACDNDSSKRAACRAEVAANVKKWAFNEAVTERNHEQSVRLLHDHGAVLLIDDDMGRNLWLFLTLENGAMRQQIYQKLKDVPFDTVVEAGLRISISHGWNWWTLEKFLEAILSTGCGVDSIPCLDGQTAMQYFATYSHLKAVRYFLERGADIHRVTPEGVSVLHLAIYYIHHPITSEELCELIIEYINSDQSIVFNHTLPSDQTCRGGKTLHLAVRTRSDSIVTQLIKSGVDFEVENDDGKTPLDIAEEMEAYNIIEILTNPALRPPE